LSAQLEKHAQELLAIWVMLFLWEDSTFSVSFETQFNL
jgi:hypothetical protein